MNLLIELVGSFCQVILWWCFFTTMVLSMDGGVLNGVTVWYTSQLWTKQNGAVFISLPSALFCFKNLCTCNSELYHSKSLYLLWDIYTVNILIFWLHLKISNSINIFGCYENGRWFAKRFLHPDIVDEYSYIFLWDEDLGVENFNPKRYMFYLRIQEMEYY